MRLYAGRRPTSVPKLTKQQRRTKRNHKRLEKKKRKDARKRTRQKPWVAPKMKFFELPNFLPADMPREQRLEIVRSMGKRAQEKFEEQYPKIAHWFERYDSIYLLSFCAFYFVSHKEGIDPELEADFFPHHYLEILQAFALAQERSYKVTPLLDQIVKIKAELKELGEAMQLRLLNVPPEITADAELNAFQLRSQMMLQTTAIRNWAYMHQMQRVVIDLAERISGSFKSIYDIHPVDLFQMLFKLVDERSELLNEHRQKLRIALKHRNYKDMLAAYNDSFPENTPIEGADADGIWEVAGRKIGALRAMLICHADLKLDEIYSFTVEHARSLLNNAVTPEILERVLDSLSHRFGDLREFPKEHIILGNPVWGRPI